MKQVLRDKIKLGLPFENPKYNRISQFFGANESFYSRYGLKGHNGIDHLSPRGTPILAVCDGYCSGVKTTKEGYGIYVRQTSGGIELEGKTIKLDIIYGHLEKVALYNGESIEKGDVIGWADNTGYSLGHHLHLGVRIMNSSGQIENYNNGFFGYIDHYSLLETPISWLTYWKWKGYTGRVVDEWETLPVDKRYDIEEEKQLPWTSYIWLGITLRRQLTEQEHNALAYGHWDFKAVFSNRIGDWWKYYTKQEYKYRVTNGLGL